MMKSVFKSIWTVLSGSKSNVSEEKEQTNTLTDSYPVNPQPNNCYSGEQESSKRLADAVKEKSKLLEPKTGPVLVYKVPLEEKNINIPGSRRFSFGKESLKHNRTIMVLGATGAGKSTLINGMINYILGVEWKDPYRFKLVHEDPSKSQAHSQTSEVTVYKINHQDGFKIDHSLTIVDTPGFGDTGGIERDKEITEQLRNVFSSKLGVSEIDAVCFVAQASLARLTPSQKYVFDSVLSIFGKDVAENIRVLVTFADGQLPPVLEAIKASGVPCPKTEDGLPLHFKFNNSALFADSKLSAAGSMMEEDEDGSFDQMFWNMGTRSMKKFFDALNVIETKSLTLTKEVLKERKELEDAVENLQKQVKLGLAKLEEIKETSEKLKEHEAEISRNENFEFEVTVNKPVQEDISGTKKYITNCQQCYYTCHYPCGIANDAAKRGCIAIGPDGDCKRCPGNCHWDVHFNQKYRWEYKEVKEKRTIKELQEKYKQAKDAKTPVEAMIVTLKAEYDRVQAEVVRLIKSSTECLNKLKEIALKPNPLSTPEYIDMLIEGEKSEGKPGWKQRVQSLMTMRDKAETLAKIVRGEKLLQSSPNSNNQTKNNYNQNKTKTKTSQTSEVTANPDEDKDKLDSDANTSQDSEVNANPEKDKLDSDDSTSQDSEVNEVNPEKDKLDSDDSTSQDSEVNEVNPDQDKLDSDVNTSQDSEVNADPDQEKSDSDDSTSQDSEVNEVNPEKDKLDSDDSTSQDSEVNEVNPDQDKLDSDVNTSQDSEVNADPDQEKSDSDDNTSQDSEVNAKPDQDKLDSDVNTSQDSNLD